MKHSNTEGLDLSKSIRALLIKEELQNLADCIADCDNDCIACALSGDPRVPSNENMTSGMLIGEGASQEGRHKALVYFYRGRDLVTRCWSNLLTKSDSNVLVIEPGKPQYFSDGSSVLCVHRRGSEYHGVGILWSLWINRENKGDS
jgi:hypothetical protein